MRNHPFKIFPAFGMASALALGLLVQASGARAASGEADYKEQNTQKPVTGTHETRKAERQAARKKLSAENKQGKIPQHGEAGPPAANPNPNGLTRAERHQEIRAKQKELAELEKSGKMPVSNEAGVNVPAR